VTGLPNDLRNFTNVDGTMICLFFSNRQLIYSKASLNSHHQCIIKSFISNPAISILKSRTKMQKRRKRAALHICHLT